MLATYDDIKEWLENRDIFNYKINSTDSGYIIDVRGNVFIDSRSKNEIPVQFGVVTGDFWCSANDLKTLQGAPHTVLGEFYCHHNNLQCLVGGPQKVEKGYFCSNNPLISLEGFPKEAMSVDIMNTGLKINYDMVKDINNIVLLMSLDMAPQCSLNYKVLKTTQVAISMNILQSLIKATELQEKLNIDLMLKNKPAKFKKYANKYPRYRKLVKSHEYKKLLCRYGINSECSWRCEYCE